MPRSLSLLRLPADVLSQLDERIRDACYGNIRPITSWLADRGHVFGKSSVGRYVERLRGIDAKNGHAVASILETRPLGQRRALAKTSISPREREMLDLFRTFSLADQNLWISHLKGRRPAELSTIKPAKNPVSASK